MILSLAHILHSKSKSKDNYETFSSSFYKELQEGWKSKTNSDTLKIKKSLDEMLRLIGSKGSSNAQNEFDKFNRDFLNSRYLSPDQFMSIFKLCKIKDIIFLHPSSNSRITFDGNQEIAGYYIGNLDENTPYIVNTENNHFQPGVGKLNSQMIKLIKDSYKNLSELRENAPIDISCRGSVRFS